jgi:hypothetical protein
MVDQLKPNEALLTGQEQINCPWYFLLNAHDLSSLHLRSCNSRSMNGSTLHTDFPDKHAWFILHGVFVTISGSTFMLLEKVMVFTFSRYSHRLNIHEIRNPIYKQPGQ